MNFIRTHPPPERQQKSRERLRLGVASVTDTSKAPDAVYPTRTSFAPFLSVRTAFDLYLKALRLPRGSLVVCSPLTIPDMVTILCEHGLVPIPIDLDPSTLAPNARALETEVSRRRAKSADGDSEARVRAIYVAHVFGAQVRSSYKAYMVRSVSVEDVCNLGALSEITHKCHRRHDLLYRMMRFILSRSPM